MAPKTPKETTQITKVELPKWVDAASQQNYQLAQKISAKPYVPYKGQTVAATDPITLQANKYFQDTMGTGNAERDQANALFADAGKGITAMDRGAYMNPFTDEVITRSLNDMDRSRQMAQAGLASNQIKDKTFGGSRSAISSALLDAETTRGAGDLAAKLRAQGFDTASGLMQSDLDRKMTAGTGFLSSADAANKLRMGNFAGLTGIGQANQQQQQRVLDDLKARFDEKQGFDDEKLNRLLSALGMSPYGKTENTKKTESGGGGTDFAQMGAGILSLLPALFALSDEREKKDKKKIGKDKKTGIDIYSYRYKGDKPNSHKTVGPMAQDVEKKIPGAVIEVAGKKLVRRDILAEIANV